MIFASDQALGSNGRYTSLFRHPAAQIAIAMATIAAGCYLVSSAFWVTTLTTAFSVVLACAGIGVLYNQLGLASLCQYALVGVGGWVALRISHGTGLPFEICIVLAGVASALVGVAWSYTSLRLRGLYFALSTLMLAGAFQVVISATGFPDGGGGVLGKVTAGTRLLMPRPALAQSNEAYLLYVLAVVTLGLLLIEWHRRSLPGRTWALIRRSEWLARANGVNNWRYKAWGFALSGFLAGVSGGLLAGANGQLDGRAFLASESVLFFALSVVGGVHQWFGAIIAAFLLRLAPSLLNWLGVDGFLAAMLFGMALIHALAAAPNGVAGQISGAFRTILQRKRP